MEIELLVSGAVFVLLVIGGPHYGRPDFWEDNVGTRYTQLWPARLLKICPKDHRPRIPLFSLCNLRGDMNNVATELRSSWRNVTLHRVSTRQDSVSEGSCLRIDARGDQLLNGASYLRENSVSARSNHANDARSNAENHSQHHRVLGDVLTVRSQTELQKLTGKCLHRDYYAPKRVRLE